MENIDNPAISTPLSSWLLSSGDLHTAFKYDIALNGCIKNRVLQTIDDLLNKCVGYIDIKSLLALYLRNDIHGIVIEYNHEDASCCYDMLIDAAGILITHGFVQIGFILSSYVGHDIDVTIHIRLSSNKECIVSYYGLDKGVTLRKEGVKDQWGRRYEKHTFDLDSLVTNIKRLFDTCISF